MKHYLLIVFFTLVCGSALGGERPEITSEKSKINYSVGHQIGTDFRNQQVELDIDALVRGIRDAVDGVTPAVSGDEMRSTLLALKRKITADQEAQRRRNTGKYQREGREFLASNAKKPGVHTLASGVQYKVLKEGAGRMPTPGDTVTVHYRGTLVDGNEFDSTYRDDKPRTFPLTNVIPGWKELLPMMKEGARWQMFIPFDLAFGERGPLADRTVIYEVEMISVQSDK
ncbi:MULTISPECIES: FKBP-type peptidyl-prolyl cis-trans isomerase N-terminal domain-containing protein [Geobacter]|uniref:FKBP-type peptidyl-prolyl cis-trans isomerase N-terminal domain-containing protein n=1 Tax=Geobacter TaxID=28231 RepID=UPI00257269BF|nr:FKBP-type peptidyl-prolyl cis-trans isomerase [Geobacter sulfurreducens]BEH09357.1 macrophage infectivity potentiator Mip [Geobacter sulfurreducens subsp. ethanolicus]